MQVLIGSGCAAGLVIHQLVKRVEIDRYPLSIVGFVVGAYFVMAAALKNLAGVDDVASCAYTRAFIIEGSTIMSLWVNILVYVSSWTLQGPIFSHIRSRGMIDLVSLRKAAFADSNL
jgi:hypothetical protein